MYEEINEINITNNHFKNLKLAAETILSSFEKFGESKVEGKSSPQEILYGEVLSIGKKEKLSLEFSLYDELFLLEASISPDKNVQSVYFKTYHIEKDMNNYPKLKLVPIPDITIRLNALGNLTTVANTERNLSDFNKEYSWLVYGCYKNIKSKV